MSIDPSVFKAYDIRGIYPQSIDRELAYKIGVGYAQTTKPDGEVLVGEDVRLHSHELKESLIQGLLDSGVNVVDVGKVSTDMYYFGVGKYNLAGGIQATASHNPPEWHGFKMVIHGPTAMSLEDGLSAIHDYILNDYVAPSVTNKGRRRQDNIWDDFVEYALGWIKGKTIKPFKIVINPNFGFAGQVFKLIIEKGKLPIELISLNGEPDGSFPKGRPDPYIPENRFELCDLVKSEHADLGITWDADADRVFFVNETGEFIDPYYLNTLLIKEMLDQYPGSAIVYEPRYQWATLDTITQNGGKPVLCQVGHSYIKQKMRESDAIFASESSGHTYYKDFWYADCGMIPALQVLSFCSSHPLKLSEAVAPIISKYHISGEINSEIDNKIDKINEIASHYIDGQQSRLDGISVEYSDWRFCVRPSNTEPLLRLTLEAKSRELMQQKRNEVLSLIRS